MQAYALQEKLKLMKCDARIIDFRLDHFEQQYRLLVLEKGNIGSTCKSLASFLLNLPLAVARKRGFTRFIDGRLQLTGEHYGTLVELQKHPPDADIYICGSDQIWNPYITGELQSAYFLDFGNDKTKRISYAPSFGRDTIDDIDKGRITALLRRFDAISVREDEGVRLLHSVGVNNVCSVVDPVLLHHREFWSKMCQGKSSRLPYLLIYTLEYNPMVYRLARKIAQEKGLKILHIKKSWIKRDGEDVAIVAAGPEAFVNLISNAKYVVTNSFHAAAFSVIFEKEFLVVPHSMLNSRLRCLLDWLALGNRMSLDTVPQDSIEYDEVNKLLDEHRRFSEEFLKTWISSEAPIKD